MHHEHADTRNDPYDGSRKFWWTRHGWVLHELPRDRDIPRYTKDIARDPVYRSRAGVDVGEATMEAHKFRHLVWEFNALLDTGKYDGITTEEVKSHIRAGTISSFLVIRFSGDLDLNYMEAEDWTELSDEWQRIDNAVDARRKMVGIENRGLCLLLGYALESFQQRTSQE